MIDRILSRRGPEAPPDVTKAVLSEPTQPLPILPKTVLAPPPRLITPPPRFMARAVIVYEPLVRRPWRLWVFTLALVALTVGVILGQAVAYQPASRSASSAQAGTVPSDAVAPAGSGPAGPTAGQQVAVPLGTAKTRVLEVAGASTVLRIRSVDLGDTLVTATSTDGSATPRLDDTPQGPRLELVPTGGPGTVGAEIRLNAKVSWLIKITGGVTSQDIDMRGGGLAGVVLAGGSSQVVLQLPAPKGTVPVAVSGPVTNLAIRAATGTPVRLRLAKGVGTATIDGKVYHQVKPNTALTPAKWKSGKARYDVAASAPLTVISVARF